jgi:hypothetical protein
MKTIQDMRRATRRAEQLFMNGDWKRSADVLRNLADELQSLEEAVDKWTDKQSPGGEP